MDRDDAKIYCRLRKRWLVATPEEEVRQRFVSWLIDEMGYPEALMANEVSLKFNGMARRCDTVVFDRNMHPVVIVEYKAPHIAITQKVFDQIARYNMVLRARVLVVTNGRNHYCCRFDHESGGYTFLESLPSYQSII